MPNYLEEISIKIYQDFYNNNTVKKFVLTVALLFIFFYFQENIDLFIKKYLLVDQDYSSPFLDISLCICLVAISGFLYQKLVKKRYLPSTNEYFIFGFSLFVFAYYRLNLKDSYWETNIFFKIKSFKLNGHYITMKYIDLAILPLLLFFIFNIYRYLKLKKNDSDNTESNHLINDDPVYDLNDDKLEYKTIVENLTKILLNDKHKKAISIGLIGPWGNGKSSVINMVEDKIKSSKSFKKDNIIAIHFLPYLNHNDDDIINEFFITLSNELSNYNGKLSNELINYSQKLTDLYKEKNIFNSLESHFTNFRDSSANELYQSINKMLETIDKKIIVFVDDLDRLNQTEILQVLKLIRNTANFNNTIFVVAMDKEYTISRLKSSEDILNSKFIDKFFQLEIYLPEIKTQVLKEYFTKTLTDQLNPNGPSDISLKIKEAIDSPDNLFEDYITNFRDAKRTINQIIFDYPFTGGEINFKDFINFTYFKLKFPQFIKILKEGKIDFLDIDGKGFYKFKTKPKENNSNNSDDFFDIIRNIRNSKNIDLKQYLLYDDKFIKDCIINDNIIDCEDRILFVKTLAFLFGDENNVNGVDSIKYENNFRMLMEQKIYSELFKNSEFKEIIDAEYSELIRLIDNLHESKKIQQLFNRIEYFNSTDEKEVRQIITILLILFEKRDDYKLYDVYIENQIANIIDFYFKENKSDKTFSNWLQKTIFEGTILSISNKLVFFGKLWASKSQNNLWKINEEFIFNLVIRLFREYLEKKKNDIPNFNDYSIYGIYHSIKNIGTLNGNIKEIFLDFWTPEKNEILCVHFIEMDPFTQSLFKISDIATELFGSKTNFVNHIKTTSKNPNSGLIEIISFLDLCEINGHASYTIYKFTHSIPMIEKVKTILNGNSRSNYNGSDNMTQIFFVTSSQTLQSKITNDQELKEYHFGALDYNSLHYIKSTINRKINNSELIKIAQRISDIAIRQDLWESVAFDKELVLRKENFVPQSNPEKYIKLYSIQPSII